MSHRAPFNSRSHNGSPAPVLIPGHQYGASSGRASPFGNPTLRTGPRNVYSNAGTDDNQLLHPTPSHTGMSYAANSNSAVPRFTESPYQSDSYSRTAQQLEHQNDDKLEGLMSKVRILKDVTIGIGDEVRQSNMELGNMVRRASLDNVGFE
ncbi:hypothetical protein QFC20_002965 [Naganishia adeliensis]|uniref:Uncharacterized protein n=1 Tax=Naganishia adeliensis TaxID=92952 RepID=A0ACC2WFY0_9TREE|nr:hypothetical protein QFC20_002965 [Naganishia adeliensis]